MRRIVFINLERMRRRTQAKTRETQETFENRTGAERENSGKRSKRHENVKMQKHCTERTKHEVNRIEYVQKSDQQPGGKLQQPEEARENIERKDHST